MVVFLREGVLVVDGVLVVENVPIRGGVLVGEALNMNDASL